MKAKQIKSSVSQFNKIENILWLSLFIVSTISLFSVLGTYIRGGDEIRDPKWVEMIMIPFYFTIQSNLLAFVLSWLMTFKKIKNNKKIKILSLFMVVNLVATFIVYWIVLFPDSTLTNWEGWLRNMTLHGLTPILGVAVFIFRYIINNKKGVRMNVWTRSAIHLIYPIVWLIIAIILYFLLGSDDKDAIYSFLRLKTSPIKFVVYVLVIATFYYLSTALFIFLSNSKK